jgi:hypothetical protein
MSTPSSVPVTAEEMNRLIAECRKLPVAAGAYASENFEPYDDFITNVLLTVLDLQMHNVAVNKSILHYRTHRWADVRTLEDLERVLREFPTPAPATVPRPSTYGETTTGRASNGCVAS